MANDYVCTDKLSYLVAELKTEHGIVGVGGVPRVEIGGGPGGWAVSVTPTHKILGIEYPGIKNINCQRQESNIACFFTKPQVSCDSTQFDNCWLDPRGEWLHLTFQIDNGKICGVTKSAAALVDASADPAGSGGAPAEPCPPGLAMIQDKYSSGAIKTRGCACPPAPVNVDRKGRLKTSCNSQATTTRVEFYENGQKKKEATYKDDHQDGPYTLWYINGQKQGEATYCKAGWNVGPYTEWYSHGQKQEEGTFDKNGRRVGLYTEWYPSGKKKEESTYKNGKRSGLSTFWYKNGQKESEGTYDNDRHVGTATLWYENGNKMEESTYKSNVRNGVSTQWYKDGNKQKECVYRNDKIVLGTLREYPEK